MTTLDTSRLSNLAYLNIEGATAFTSLKIPGVNLEELDTTGMTALGELDVSGNHLAKLSLNGTAFTAANVAANAVVSNQTHTVPEATAAEFDFSTLNISANELLSNVRNIKDGNGVEATRVGESSTKVTFPTVPTKITYDYTVFTGATHTMPVTLTLSGTPEPTPVTGDINVSGDVAPAVAAGETLEVPYKVSEDIAVSWDVSGADWASFKVTDEKVKENTLVLAPTSSVTEGTYNLTITATSDDKKGTLAVTVTVSGSETPGEPTAPIITPASIVGAQVTEGDSYTYDFSAKSSTDITWTATVVAATGTGSLTGTFSPATTSEDKTTTLTIPTAEGTADTYTVTVTAENEVGSKAVSFTLNVITEEEEKDQELSDKGMKSTLDADSLPAATSTAVKALDSSLPVHILSGEYLTTISETAGSRDALTDAQKRAVSGDIKAVYYLPQLKVSEKAIYIFRAPNNSRREGSLMWFPFTASSSNATLAADTDPASAVYMNNSGMRLTSIASTDTAVNVAAVLDPANTYVGVVAAEETTGGGGSSGGCDAGFGALALALAGLFGLKRK